MTPGPSSRSNAHGRNRTLWTKLAVAGALLCSAFATVWLIGYVANRESSDATPGQTQTVTFTADTTTDFPNPERGFYRARDDALAEPVPRVRSENFTLVRTQFRLDAYRTTATLPQSFLDGIAGYFARQRALHQKSEVIFQYNHADNGADASSSIMVGHIKQVAPILAANKDVIAWFDAGFIGAWGEWHSSTNDLIDENPYSRALTSGGRAVWDAMKDHFPQDRQILIRYPAIKMHWYGWNDPLQASEAWNGTTRARIGFFNWGFLTDAADSTFWYSSPDGTHAKRQSYRTLQEFVHAEADYVAMSGETDRIGGIDPNLQGCTNAKRMLAHLHFTALNRGWWSGVLDQWVSGGCMPEIKRKLGYRFRITSARLPTSVTPGGRMPVTINVTNDGYAAMPNQRPVNLVLRNRTTGAVARLATGLDPRKWLSGTTKRENFSRTVPADLAAGNYDVLLEIPDPLQPAAVQESVRLAMAGTWESTTGFNSLRATVALT
jgi:Domain of unknown function (DUF4832)/Domain of unknown function (DUF4874)